MSRHQRFYSCGVLWLLISIQPSDRCRSDYRSSEISEIALQVLGFEAVLFPKVQGSNDVHQ
jgi:hypothetical protein